MSVCFKGCIYSFLLKKKKAINKMCNLPKHLQFELAIQSNNLSKHLSFSDSLRLVLPKKYF